MKSYTLLALAILMSAGILRPQADPGIVQPILSRRLQSAPVVTYQLQQFLQARVPALVVPAGAEAWTAAAQRLRRHLSGDVIFHGWPVEWLNSPPRFQDLGALPAGKGYTLHRLRYEIVPGCYSTALLYKPEALPGRLPGQEERQQAQVGLSMEMLRC